MTQYGAVADSAVQPLMLTLFSLHLLLSGPPGYSYRMILRSLHLPLPRHSDVA